VGHHYFEILQRYFESSTNIVTLVLKALGNVAKKSYLCRDSNECPARRVTAVLTCACAELSKYGRKKLYVYL
jgi:hypothetical protein